MRAETQAARCMASRLRVMISLGVGVGGICALHLALKAPDGSRTPIFRLWPTGGDPAPGSRTDQGRVAALAEETTALREQIAQLTNRLSDSSNLSDGGGNGRVERSAQSAQRAELANSAWIATPPPLKPPACARTCKPH